MVNENQQSTNTGKTINYAVNKENNKLILKKNYGTFMKKKKKQLRNASTHTTQPLPCSVSLECIGRESLLFFIPILYDIPIKYYQTKNQTKPTKKSIISDPKYPNFTTNLGSTIIPTIEIQIRNI